MCGYFIPNTYGSRIVTNFGMVMHVGEWRVSMDQRLHPKVGLSVRNFGTCAQMVLETTTKSCKFYTRKILQGSSLPLPWPKNFVTQMLT